MQNNVVFSANQFSTLEDTPFKASDYSLLKFGNKKIAEEFGRELAQKFFKAHSELILSERLIIVPSPYNFVKNAASLVAKSFFNNLNRLTVAATGRQTEYMVIQRKVSYTMDYGFLPKEKRKGLLDNDLFYINREYVGDKTLVFIDDVKITGTHEDKLKEILAREQLDFQGHFFLYFAEYLGQEAEIESKLNFASNNITPGAVADMINTGTSELIIRPIKFLMSADEQDFANAMAALSLNKIYALYDACLAEGYHKIPSYQYNFNELRSRIAV